MVQEDHVALRLRQLVEVRARLAREGLERGLVRRLGDLLVDRALRRDRGAIPALLLDVAKDRPDGDAPGPGLDGGLAAVGRGALQDREQGELRGVVGVGRAAEERPRESGGPAGSRAP